MRARKSSRAVTAKKCTKNSVMNVQSCCFANKPIAFLSFSLRQRRPCLSSPLLWSRNFANMITWRNTSPLLHLYSKVVKPPNWDRWDFAAKPFQNEIILCFLSEGKILEILTANFRHLLFTIVFYLQHISLDCLSPSLVVNAGKPRVQMSVISGHDYACWIRGKTRIFGQLN